MAESVLWLMLILEEYNVVCKSESNDVCFCSAFHGLHQRYPGKLITKCDLVQNILPNFYFLIEEFSYVWVKYTCIVPKPTRVSLCTL